jgi:hypothetical protein
MEILQQRTSGSGSTRFSLYFSIWFDFFFLILRLFNHWEMKWAVTKATTTHKPELERHKQWLMMPFDDGPKSFCPLLLYLYLQSSSRAGPYCSCMWRGNLYRERERERERERSKAFIAIPSGALTASLSDISTLLFYFILFYFIWAFFRVEFPRNMQLILFRFIVVVPIFLVPFFLFLLFIFQRIDSGSREVPLQVLCVFVWLSPRWKNSTAP